MILIEFECHHCGTHKRSSKELPRYWSRLLGEATDRYLCGQCISRSDRDFERRVRRVLARENDRSLGAAAPTNGGQR